MSRYNTAFIIIEVNDIKAIPYHVLKKARPFPSPEEKYRHSQGI